MWHSSLKVAVTVIIGCAIPVLVLPCGFADGDKPPLDFKGLRLGMTKEDIEHLIETTEWSCGHTFTRCVWEDSFQLFPQFHRDLGGPTEFGTIGSKGPDGRKTYYRWTSASGSLYEGRVYDIDVHGPDVTADYIDSRLKPWLRIAYEGLVRKYGSPTRVILPIDAVNIFSFRPGFAVFLYEWVINRQRIRLQITTFEARYRGKINYTDLETEKKLEEASTTETTL